MQDEEPRRRDAEADLAERMKLATARLEADLKRVQDLLAAWQDKYEQQRVQNRELESLIQEARKQVAEAKATVKARDAEMAAMASFADLLLGRFDWPKVGAQMKLTPTLRRQFNSLIKRLNYEEDRSLVLEGTLPQFWDGLIAEERELVTKIAQSNTLEVANGDVAGFWAELTDTFEDVRIGLEARTVLLKILQEIFYQVLEMGDLKAPAIPRNMADAEKD